MRVLLILFILLGFPALEIFVLAKLAGIIGWWLLLWLILSAFVGWTLIQEEKLAMFGRLFSALQSGQPLGYAMLDSMRTLLAGVLLIFPGVVSDVMALVLLIRPQGLFHAQG
ncbi:MAG: FxsA family protein [Sulfurimicrobium sp.]